MGPINGVNLERVKYFSLEEYIGKIHLCKDTLYHVESTSNEFENYIKFLSNYNQATILDYLIDSFKVEVQYSNMVEKHLIRPDEVNQNDVYFDSLSMSHNRSKQLHSFVQEDEDNFKEDYRDKEARVSYIDDKGKEHIFWYGAEPEDIKKFMDDYINIYKSNGVKLLDSSPFLKAALCHLLFVRIHPFGDGNGRTARLIHDMKFTKMINKLYDTNLKISPLHLSMSIYLNQPTYAKKINDIYFDLKHDCNDEINKYFDFMLNMTDDQIHYLMTDQAKWKLDELARFNIDTTTNEATQEAKGMKIKKLLH